MAVPVTGVVNRIKDLIANRHGRLVGVVLGLLLGGVVGALLGFLLGWGLDLSLRLLPFAPWRWARVDPEADDARLWPVFFGWLGRIAKSDGRVSRNEIGAVREIMSDLGLGAEARRLAIDLFSRGKAAPFPGMLLARAVSLGTGADRARRAVRLASRVAVADRRPPSDSVREELMAFARLLGVSETEVAVFLEPREPSARAPIVPARTLSAAFELLGVNEGADRQSVKLAYRRMVSANHPDRVVALGLPDSEVRAAGERTRVIREAYELIRRHGRA